MNLFDLTGKTALVLGGNGVLGSAMARALAGHGARVAIAGRNLDTARQVATTLGPDTAAAFQVDARSRASVEAMVQEVAEWSNGIDIFIHCAGVNSKKPFFEVTDEDWDHVMDTNAKSAFITCQVVGKHMLARGHGSIILTSSVSSGPPRSGVFAYSASKAALNSITQYLAREFAPQVRVNAIIPGFFPAEQNRRILTQERVNSILAHTPMGRLGEPEELQGTAVWLASDAASGFVTGALIRVDGGFGAVTI